MFCSNCGKNIPYDSQFCFNCGQVIGGSVTDVHSKMNTGSQVKLVPAKCTACGASLEVDARENAAICPYCKNAYIVDQAINNYNIKMNGNLNVGSATINVSGVNVNNLLIRAKDFTAKGDFENALDYYNRVLDIDFRNQKAHDGIERMKDYIFFESDASIGTFSSGVLQLRKEMLIYLSSRGKEDVYYLDQIDNLSKSFNCIQFLYPCTFLAVTIRFKENLHNKWFDIINSAMKGSYLIEYF